MNFLINNMQVKLAGFGILSLFLIMLAPVYAEVTEFSIEKNFYTIDEGIVFVGNTSEDTGSTVVNVLMMTDPNGDKSLLVTAVSNLQMERLKQMPKSVDEYLLQLLERMNLQRLLFKKITV